ncbi:MAG: CvpA family protein [Clostridiales bacterium]|nr:CvpA family protein [Clostridiales bacterium]
MTFLSIVLDILLVALVVVFIVLGVKKGLLATVLELVAIGLALFCAIQLAAPIADGVYHGVLEKSMINKINDEIGDEEKTDNQKKTEYALEALPDYVETIAKCVGIDEKEFEARITRQNISTQSAIAETVVVNVIEPIAISALKIIFFFVLSAMFILIFRLIAKAIGDSAKVNIIKQVDSIVGGTVGLIKGIVVLVIASTLLTLMMTGGGEEDSFSQAVNKSYIVNFINENLNPFIDTLKDGFINL